MQFELANLQVFMVFDLPKRVLIYTRKLNFSIGGGGGINSGTNNFIFIFHSNNCYCHYESCYSLFISRKRNNQRR